MIVRGDTDLCAATVTAEKAQSTAQGQAVTTVPGVGDYASSLTISGGGFTTNAFAVRKRTATVQVNGSGTVAQTLAYAIALVNKS